MCSLDWLALGQLKFYRGVSTEDTTSRNLQLTLKGHPCTPYIGYADHDGVHDVVNGRIGNMCYMLVEGRGAGIGRERGGSCSQNYERRVRDLALQTACAGAGGFRSLDIM